MNTTTTYAAIGLTCGHCVNAVTEELSTLPGVTGVTVDLNVGGPSPVHVTSDAPLDEVKVRAAIDEAGYTLADQAP